MIFATRNLEAIVLKYHELSNKLPQRQDNNTDIFEELHSIIIDQFHATLDQDLGEMAQMFQEVYEAGKGFTSLDLSEHAGRVGASSWCP